MGSAREAQLNNIVRAGLFGQALNCTWLSRASLAVTTGETYETIHSRHKRYLYIRR